MCGPYGHSYIAVAEGNNPFGGNEDNFGGNTAELSRKPKPPKDSTTRDTVNSEIRRERALRGWETRRKNLAAKISTGGIVQLSPNLLMLPGYSTLNSHSEIRSAHSDIDITESIYVQPIIWAAAGILLGNGKFVVQRRSSNLSRGFMTREIVSIIEAHWVKTIRGKFAEFVGYHAGRLSDLTEWSSDFYKWLDPRFVMSKLRGYSLKNEFTRLLNRDLLTGTLCNLREEGLFSGLYDVNNPTNEDRKTRESIEKLRHWSPSRSLTANLQGLFPEGHNRVGKLQAMLRSGANEFVSGLL